jgi:hypothetical protein
MDRDVMDFMHGLARQRDAFEVSLGDTLDVKGSILLAAIPIVAALTGYILTVRNIPLCLYVAQVSCSVFLALAGVLVIAELWPRDYYLDAMPESFAAWIRDTVSESSDDAQTAIVKILEGDIENCCEGIAINHKINVTKSRLLNWAFFSLVAAVAVSLGSLFMIAAVFPVAT